MNANLTKDTLTSVKKSYINILSLFLGDQHVESRFVKCLLKWAIQLEMTPHDIKHSDDLDLLTFIKPEQKAEQIEALYHLILVIYMDKKVEDIELEIATIYAGRLGFKPEIVGELFKSIATAPYDGVQPRDVHKEVSEFIKTAENWRKG